MKFRTFPVFGSIIIVSCLASVRAAGPTIEEALSLCQQSGRPMLIVAGRPTCGNTTAVLGHLQTPTLVPVVSQFVNVYVNVDKPEGDACQQKYGHPGDTLPYVYVVRADGEKLYSHSGFMESNVIRAALLEQAAKAGKALGAKDTALLQKALEAAKQAHEKGDSDEAIKALLSVKRLGVFGSSTCYAKTAVEAAQLATELTDEGKATLKKVDEKFADGKPGFEAALAYTKAKRTLTPLPTLKTELAAAARKYEHLHELADTLRQAEALDRAQVAAALPHNAKKAADAFQRIVAAYPDTEAAKLAAEELQKLPDDGSGSSGATVAKPAYRTWADTTGQFSVKARYRGVKDDKLSLETEDGRLIQVPLDKLSETDRKFLASRHESE